MLINLHESAHRALFFDVTGLLASFGNTSIFYEIFCACIRFSQN